MPRSRPVVEPSEEGTKVFDPLAHAVNDPDVLVPFKSFVHVVFETFPPPDGFTGTEPVAATMLITLACLGKSEAVRQQLLSELMQLHHAMRNARLHSV